MTRTTVAQRVIRKAQYIVRQHARGERVKPLMLDWARAVVRFNCPDFKEEAPCSLK